MESVVVSDTSPIRALAHLGLINVLESIVNEVIIPPAVEAELANPPASLKRVSVAEFSFVRIRKVSDPLKLIPLLNELDAGEAEAIVVAQESGIRTLLIDEAAGRAKARSLGLEVVGTVGILLRARQLGRIDAIAPLLDDLRDRLGFFISDEFRRKALDLAGE